MTKHCARSHNGRHDWQRPKGWGKHRVCCSCLRIRRAR
jgi:hypothetical protein